MKKPLIVIAGPTATGKSDVAVSLARRIGGEIISADSMQVYRHMDIGTAKITPDRMRGVRHHLIDVVNPDEPFNVALFKELAVKAIDGILRRGRIPIMAGGTGFYIRAVLYDTDFASAKEDASYRESLKKIADEKGAGKLFDMLRSADPKSAEMIHPNNVKRVIRALEYKHLTGENISEHNRSQRLRKSPYDYRYFVLTEERSRLYGRIDERVCRMMDAGLIDEVIHLRDMGLTADMQSAKGLGYKEIFMYLDGRLTYDEAAEEIKKDTRHYAKRQITWFKGQTDAIRLDRGEFKTDDRIADEIWRLAEPITRG